MKAGRKPGAGAKLTSADLVSLGLLSRGPAHGHEVWSRLNAHDVQDWAEVSRAQIYYSLDKLAQRGLIRAVSGEGRADRRTWRISAEGQRALTDALSSATWARNRVVSPFNTWVALSEHAWPAVRARVLSERRRFLGKEITREQATAAELADRSAELPGVAVARAMVDLAIRQMATELAWLDELEATLGT